MSFLDDVNAFLEDMDGPPSTGFWTCPACGEDVGGKFSNTEGCEACGLSVNHLDCYQTVEFSTSPCDCCGSSYSGARYAVIGWLEGASDHGYTEEYRWNGEICTDCLFFFANGDLPDEEEE